MDVQTLTLHHFIKNEELNHHGTLYAGRAAEWFVEAGFIAAASLLSPENIVCYKIHGMIFSRPVHKGEIVKLTSKIVKTGRTKLVAYIYMSVGENKVVDGFITFVHVDEHGQPQPHGLVIQPTTEEDRILYEQANSL